MPTTTSLDNSAPLTASLASDARVSRLSSLRDSLSLVAGKYATSQRVGLPILLLLSLNIAQAGYQETGTYAGLQIQVVLFALVCGWLYFSLFGLIINIGFPRIGWSRTTSVVLLFATTDMIRTTLVYFFSTQVGLAVTADWPIRLTAAATTGLVFFGILSALINDTERYREIYRQHFEQRVRLETTVLAAQETLVQTHVLLRKRIRQQLNQALASVIDEFHRVTPRYGFIVDRLFAVVDDVVRPASYELFDSPVEFQQSKELSQVPRVKLWEVLREATLSSPVRPGLYFGLLALIFFPVVLGMPSFELLPLVLAALFCVYLVPAFVLKMFVPRMRRWMLWWRCVFLSVVYSVPTLAVMATLVDVYRVEASPVLLSAYGMILGFVIGWVLALLSGLHSARRALLSELQEVNDELYWTVTRMQSQMWADQKALALTLHSDVQSTLLAAALKLRVALETQTQTVDGTEENSTEVFTEVQKLVADAASLEAGSVPTLGVRSIVERLNETWGGLIGLELIAPDLLIERVDQDAVALGVLDDLITEFQTNSVKHGRAKMTVVALQLAQPKVLKVVMSNDGNREAMPSSKGLGLHFLESVTLKHRFENTNGFKLSLQIPIH